MYVGTLVDVMNEGVIEGIKGIGKGLVRGAAAGWKSDYHGMTNYLNHKYYDESIPKKAYKYLNKFGGAIGSIPMGIYGGVAGAARGAYGGFVKDNADKEIKKLEDESARRSDAIDRATKKDSISLYNLKTYKHDMDSGKGEYSIKNIPSGIGRGIHGAVQGAISGAGGTADFVWKGIKNTKMPIIKYNPFSYLAVPSIAVGGAVGGALTGAYYGAKGGLKGRGDENVKRIEHYWEKEVPKRAFYYDKKKKH